MKTRNIFKIGNCFLFLIVLVFILLKRECRAQDEQANNHVKNVSNQSRLETIEKNSTLSKEVSSNLNKTGDSNSEDSDVEDYADDEDDDDDENENDEDIDEFDLIQDKQYSNFSLNDLNLNLTNQSSELNYRTKKPWPDKPVTTSRDLIKLRSNLLLFYDKKSRPLSNSSQPLVVKLGVSILQINNLDEIYQVLFIV